MTVNKAYHLAFLFIALAFVFLSPYFFSDYGMRILNNIAIFIILAVSYNLINGVTGQFSLEPNGFVAVGAYATAIMLLSADDKISQFALEDPSSLILALSNPIKPILYHVLLCNLLRILLNQNDMILYSQKILTKYLLKLAPILQLYLHSLVV